MSLEDVPEGVSIVAISSFRLARALKADVSWLIAQDEILGLVSWRVLVGLSIVTCATQKELVEFTKTEQAQLSRALKEMERRKLIAAQPSLEDARMKLFSATEFGRKKYQEMLPQATQFASAVDAALDPEERTQFLAMCDRISIASRAAAQRQITNRVR